MRVLVAGAGAVGAWLGGALAAAGADVALVGRPAFVAAVRAEGLRVERGGPTTRTRPAAFATVAEAGEAAPFHAVLVTVKSYDTAAIAADLALLPPSPVVSFQNGVGNEADLALRLPHHEVVAATLTTSVGAPAPGVVRGGDGGGVGLGAAPGGPDLAPLAAAFTAGGLCVRSYADPAAMKWSKLLLNLLGAASAAALGWPTGRALAHPGVFALERAAWREAQDVMAALGLRPVTLPGYRVPLLAAVGRRLPAALLRPLVVRQMARARGERLAGLAADLEAGRGRTEAPVLGGAVVAAGETVGRPTPANRALTALVGEIAADAAARGILAGRPDRLLEAVAARGWRP